jgi:uncharacterized protein (TIGR02147 family)
MKPLEAFQPSYRHILRGELESRIKTNPQFSMRAFSRDLGLSPSLCSMVLAGRRNLSYAKCVHIAQALKFNVGRTQEFLSLYLLEKSKNEKERASLVKSLKPKQAAFFLQELHEFEIISEWFHFAIVEWLGIPGASQNPSTIAKKLGLKALQVKLSLVKLESLGLIKRVGGVFVKTHKNFRVHSDTSNRAIQSHHKQILKLAELKLTALDPGERDFASLTFSGSADQMEKVKTQSRLFRKKVMKILSDSSPNNKEVFVVATQVFRVTKKEREI